MKHKGSIKSHVIVLQVEMGDNMYWLYYFTFNYKYQFIRNIEIIDVNINVALF